MVNVDIRTRVELKNETVRDSGQRGEGGNVALIGAFPSSKKRIFAATNFSQVVSHYGIKLNSTAMKDYGGVKAARRMFMDGISDYGGASSVSCINICSMKPYDFDELSDDYKEVYVDEETLEYDIASDTYKILPGSIDGSITQLNNEKIEEDIQLTFDKLSRALNQLSDEDMDILFIAGDLWDIFKHPAQTYQTYTAIKTNKKTGEEEEVTYKIPIYKHILDFRPLATDNNGNPVAFDGTPVFDTDSGEDIYNTDNLIHYWDYVDPSKVNPDISTTVKGGIIVEEENNSSTTEPQTTDGTVNSDPTDTTGDDTNTTDDDATNKIKVLRTAPVLPEGKEPLLHAEEVNGANIPIAFTIKRDANGTPMFLMKDLQIQNETIYGKSPTGKYIRNLGDVYDYILDFIDNEFTTHKPVTYVGPIFTRPDADLDEDPVPGIHSKYLRVYGETIDDNEDPDYVEPTEDNPYVNVKEWGAVEIANLFTRETNELSTAGLFYQGGIINGEEVDRIELAAHMVGFMCSLPLSQDLTYQTIPGLTAVNEEPSIGLGDAGTILNEHGICIIRPKNRLAKTHYVYNSIMPTGWHTNHVRSVNYLLKQLQFEEGLGINNIETNLMSFRVLLENVCRNVVESNDVIVSAEIGEIQVISHYHLFVPIEIVLAGIVTRINVGVSMTLQETGTATTYIKSTSGYSYSI